MYSVLGSFFICVIFGISRVSSDGLKCYCDDGNISFRRSYRDPTLGACQSIEHREYAVMPQHNGEFCEVLDLSTKNALSAQCRRYPNFGHDHEGLQMGKCAWDEDAVLLSS